MAKKQKQQKNQKTTAMVVYQTPSRQKKTTKKPKSKPSRAGDSGDLACYRQALTNPFSVDANGARVPDMFCVPTSTRRITRSVTLTSDSSGNADYICLPNAFVHGFTTQGALSNADSLNVPAGGTLQCTATQASTLAAELANYRIVGYGVKVLGTQSENLAQGRVYVATVPVSTWLNTTVPVGGQGDSHPDLAQTTGAWLTAMGIPNSSNKVAIGTLPTLTNSMLTSVSRINETPLTVQPKISSPEAFNFRQSNDSTIGFDVQDQTSTSWITAGDASYLRVSGHEAVVIGFGGTTATTAIAEIELVYHLEGTAAIADSVNSVAQANDRVVVNPVGWMNVVQQIAKLPSFRLAVEGAGNAIVPGLGTLANRLY